MSAWKNMARSLLDSGQQVLLEHEVYQLFTAAGLPVPAHVVVQPGDTVSPQQLSDLGSGRVVLKVLSRRILHKSDLGGVRLVTADSGTVQEALAEMLKEVTAAYGGQNNGEAAEIEGFLVAECVDFPQELGHELLLGARFSREFGPVITFGIGGTDAEFLSARLEAGRGHAIRSATLLDEAGIRRMLRQTMVFERISGKARGRDARIDEAALVNVLLRFRDLVLLLGEASADGRQLEELEINPLVLSRSGQLVPLDGLMRISRALVPAGARPLERIDALLHPQSVALVGVSQKMNVGRIILQNLLDAEFPRDRIHILKPDEEEIAGVRCYPSPDALPEQVDMLVLAVGAGQVPDMLEAICAADCARSVIVIPGGIAEKEGGQAIQARIDAVIAKARTLPGGGPVINGSNCLGVYCRDAGVNTLFIPEYKLPRPASDHVSRTAFFSQSGAFMICRMSRNPGLDPVYAVSYGNQMDLTLGDYLEAMLTDDAVDLVACYAEGFADLDGLKVAATIEQLRDIGKRVLFYKAGRTAEGQSASAGHTASIAGDYETCRQVLLDAGAELVETFEAFERELQLSEDAGPGKEGGSPAIAVVSNAGFECVGIADNVGAAGGRLSMARLTDRTRAALAEAFVTHRLDGLVDVKNPLDLTPMATDKAWSDCLEALLSDPGVDAAVISIVPLTAAMQTLPAGEGHREDVTHESAICARLIELRAGTTTPFVVAIDSGRLYDPMVTLLEKAGIVVFRYADEATRYLRQHLCGA